MAQFSYTAVDQANSTVRGHIQARSPKRASATLEQEGFLVVNLKKERNVKFEKINHSINRVTRLDKIFFTRHLYTLLESGIALDEAVKITAEQTDNYKFKDILLDIHKNVRSGQTLNIALRNHERYFSPFFINLVMVGEQSGKLDEVLLHLLEQQEKDYELITKVRGAMIYPSVIIAAALAIVGLMLTFVVPKIAEILTDYSVELPLATRFLIGLSEFLTNYGIVAVPLFLLLAFGSFKVWISKPRGRMQWDLVKLKLPVLKKIVTEFNLARISRAMGSLLKSGVSVDQAILMTASVTYNTHYKQSLEASVDLVRKGIPLTEILSGYPKLYPPILIRMLEVGEKTGKVDRMYEKLAIFYETSVTNTLNNLSVVIEPLLLLFIGGVVGFIAVAVLTPIWKFVETI
ncbi:MAG: hypothetical protein COT81_03865 [Candidatus Buchananbacteria bacterium CG10_big_fil_rev_8_21_14_0_10_42_9]|uniref:Type II secretion system protein GspF domain-containing protein n=1 Tax=Candidatus Buchananbacteria bacterium CG10_big_fil_rev_8_21_14_0_10_42_9 TaxID=1974526 RepID=A0A2H0W0Q7_9BACT|nr:MAG: hypothetical protein COT81_03865 [Candidatus Buchananbacteria bacterium CG10_big_fil_rev_8_21_14_0_10_42_9]